MKKIDKRIIWIVSAVIIFLLVACGAFLWIRNSSRLPVEPMSSSPQILATPAVFPVVQLTPTQPALAPGDVWMVVRVGPEFVKKNGYKYMIAVFSNQNVPSLTISRMCGAPGWPAPEAQHLYLMNYGGVLVPIEGIDSPLQRFYEFSDQ